jgi:hypothetical protein
MTTSPDDNLLVDMLTGAVAGVVGLWALDRVDWALYERESPTAKRKLMEARPGGLDPAHALVAKVSGALGRPAPSQPHPAGIATHYGIGLTTGIAYAILRRRFPAAALGFGALFGAGAWLLEDEGLNPLIGLAGPPQAYAPSTHLRGFLAHVAFGIAAEAVLRLRPARVSL